MTRRDGESGARGIWKELWLAAALGVFGSTYLGPTVSAQEEDYPPPPIELTDPNVEEALRAVAAYLVEEGKKSEVGEQVVEFVRVVMRPKEPTDGQSGRAYFFSAVGSPGRPFDVCVGVSGPCFDVPNADTPGRRLKDVPAGEEVYIEYDFSPAVIANCIGNKCKQYP
jgi:hypothetical protein